MNFLDFEQRKLRPEVGAQRVAAVCLQQSLNLMRDRTENVLVDVAREVQLSPHDLDDVKNDLVVVA